MRAATDTGGLDLVNDFGRVYETHYQAVFTAVRGVVLDHALAEDVTQEAFIKAYRARERYRPGGSLRGWLCTIGVREAISRLRRTALQRRLLHVLTFGAETARPGADVVERVDELLGQLSPKTRAVVVLHFLHGYRYREIASMLGLPDGTVASRLSQAMAQMRRNSGATDEIAARGALTE